MPSRSAPLGWKPAAESTSIVFGLVPAPIAPASFACFVLEMLSSFGMLSENAITVPERAARMSELSSRLKSYA